MAYYLINDPAGSGTGWIYDTTSGQYRALSQEDYNRINTAGTMFGALAVQVGVTGLNRSTGLLTTGGSPQAMQVTLNQVNGVTQVTANGQVSSLNDFVARMDSMYGRENWQYSALSAAARTQGPVSLSYTPRAFNFNTFGSSQSGIVSENTARTVSGSRFGIDYDAFMRGASEVEKAQYRLIMSMYNSPAAFSQISGLGALDQMAVTERYQDTIDAWAERYAWVDPDAPPEEAPFNARNYATDTYGAAALGWNSWSAWNIDPALMQSDQARTMYQTVLNRWNAMAYTSQEALDADYVQLLNLQQLYRVGSGTRDTEQPPPERTPGTWDGPTDLSGWGIDNSTQGYTNIVTNSPYVQRMMDRYLNILANPGDFYPEDVDTAAAYLDNLRVLIANENRRLGAATQDPIQRGGAPTTFEDWGIDPDRIPEAQRAYYDTALANLSREDATDAEYLQAIQDLQFAASLWYPQPSSGGDPGGDPGGGPGGNPSFDPSTWMESIRQMMAQYGTQMQETLASLQSQNNPLTSAPPDPMDSDILAAMKQARDEVLMRQGYRATFMTGPRGIGGPTTAEWGEQLSNAPGDLNAIPVAPQNPADAAGTALVPQTPATEAPVLGTDQTGHPTVDTDTLPVPSTDPLNTPEIQQQSSRRTSRQYW